MKEKFAVIWSGWKNEYGFLTAELQLSLAAAALLMVLLCSSSVTVLRNCQKIVLDIQLQDAARYMLTALEKDMVCDSLLISIGKDYKGVDKVGCRTVFGGKSYLYTLENGGLYKQTQTAGTKGKNPLYVPDCMVTEWHVRKIDDKALQIEFTLQKNMRQKTFQRIFYCLNGQVTQDEL